MENDFQDPFAQEGIAEGDMIDPFEGSGFGGSENDLQAETGAGNAAYPALQGLTFGWGDEALAGVLAAYGTFMPELAGGLPDQFSLPENFEGIKESLAEAAGNYGKNYEGIRDSIRSDAETYAKENPIASLGAELAGGLLTGGAGILKAGAKPTASVIERLMRNAGVGAAEGAVYGAGTAKEGERDQGAITGAKWGLAGGAIGGELLAKAQRWLGGKSELQENILQKIMDGSEDIDTAFYKVLKDAVQDPTPEINTNVPRLNFDGADDAAEAVMESARPVGTPRLKKDRAQVNAARQGLSEGVLPVIYQANDATKKKLSQMNKKLKDNLKNARTSLTQRVTDVAGESAMERFVAVKNINKAAGRKIDAAAKDLQKFEVNFDPAINEFLKSLDNMGVNLGNSPKEFFQKLKMGQRGERKKSFFQGSSFEGIKGAEEVIDTVFQRLLSNGRGMNAWDGHILKKYLDTQVNFGSDGAKIKDVPELDAVLKTLRHNVDQTLDNNFDNYRLANDDYSKTVGALNEFKRIMPNHIDLLDPSQNGAAAVGTELRNVMSNSKKRIPTLNVLAKLDNLASEFDVKFDDDLLTQIMYADELERITGSSARTGISGEIGKSIKEAYGAGNRPIKDTIANWVSEKGEGAIFGEVSNENLIKALDELLKTDGAKAGAKADPFNKYRKSQGGYMDDL